MSVLMSSMPFILEQDKAGMQNIYFSLCIELFSLVTYSSGINRNTRRLTNHGKTWAEGVGE